MSSYAFDANILIYALHGDRVAHAEIARVDRPWISRIAWIEVMSKESGATMRNIQTFLNGFSIDEIDLRTAEHAAALRRERPRLRLADALILASAQVNHRILVTNNTKDFPANMPGIRVPYTL
ncbi:MULTISPECIES: PIN domain-containing protein [unclassified Sphingomonas]|uniref:PIN domain-containing protein n=1 Tax=unclassified Sphingomonas TaxID=196159 RepID=UPI00082B2FAA|nr:MULTISPECIES: PIN domain-containing protein [unclassified Sphingomonas]